MGQGPRRLRVPGKLGRDIKLKRHRPLAGKPKTAHLVLRAGGKWHVLIVCDLGDPPPKREGAAVGLDVGLEVFLADSAGRTIANPRHHRAARKKLRRAQRKVSRRKKGSNRRRKAARRVAKLHLKVARKRKDFLHKVARRYVDEYATIVVEDLNVAGLVKNSRLAQGIHDASWRSFVQILESKAEEAGSRVVRVPPHFTSQRCSGCGDVVRKSLSVRTHNCMACGHAEDRDVNAAKNILACGQDLMARTGPSGQNVAGCGERAPRSRPLV